MNTENIKICQTLSHDLENFHNYINKLRGIISNLKSSIRNQEVEIGRLRIEIDQLQSLAAAIQTRGGIGGAAAGAAARFKITRNTITISRLEAEIASTRREIGDKEFTLGSREQSARDAENKIKELGCRF